MTIPEVTRIEAWGFTCPICHWPGIGQTRTAAEFVARFHMQDIHRNQETPQ